MNSNETVLACGDMHYANKKMFWDKHDCEKRYSVNLKRRYDTMLKNNWIDAEEKIIYEFNSWGFRSPEFTETGGIMFLGCSFVAGIGIPGECRFSHIVSERMGLPMYCMGVTGGSNDTAFRLASYWIPKLKPKHVVFMSTYKNRIEVIINDEQYKTPFYYPDRYSRSYLNNFIANEANTYLLNKKNTLAIQQICYANSSNFMLLDVEKNVPYLDLARDLTHAGIKSNLAWADTITDFLTTN